ncbi:MAG: DUF3560 domain-containing protein [Treponema sp.]|jgi:prefoldin subunit 5|nr:DUF3560 domain-containing protein [Treponema sp.]
MAIGRTDYEERKEEKIEYFNGQAEKATIEANAQHKKAMDISSVIPLGQPILVGHHSEGRHRADIKRIDTATRKSVEALDKAEYYSHRADTLENNRAISGDDPEAINRYKTKLAELEKAQEQMKKINAYWRKHKTFKGCPGLSDEKAAELDEQMKTAYSWIQRTGPFDLKSNNAEIHRIKEKLETLSTLDGMTAETITFNGGELFINVDINRVQFLFPSKPSEEVRSLLKSNGFRWAPSESAWQRQRTQIAIRTAKDLIPQLEAM